MLKVLGPSVLLTLISLSGDLIHLPVVSYHTYFQTIQFLSPVLILPLNSRLIYLFIVCLPFFEYLKGTSCSSSLRLDLMISFRSSPDPGSLWDHHRLSSCSNRSQGATTLSSDSHIHHQVLLISPF